MVKRSVMGRPVILSQQRCASIPCQKFLSVSAVGHGFKRCKECREAEPWKEAATIAYTPSRSPWEGKTREELSAYVTKKDTERRRGSRSFGHPQVGP